MYDLFETYRDKKSGDKFLVPTRYSDLLSLFDHIPESIFDWDMALNDYRLVQKVQDETLNGIVVAYFNKLGNRFPRVLKQVGCVGLQEQDYKISLEITVAALKAKEENLISGSIALNKARDEFDRQRFDEQTQQFFE